MKLYSYLKKKKGELFPNKNPFKDGPYGVKSEYLDIYNIAKSKEVLGYNYDSDLYRYVMNNYLPDIIKRL